MSRNKPLANMTAEEIARAGNVSKRTARWLRDAHGKRTVQELRVQSCDDCGRTLVIHDTLSWIVQIHRTRCDNCASRVRALNPDYDIYESYFVT